MDRRQSSLTRPAAWLPVVAGALALCALVAGLRAEELDESETLKQQIQQLDDARKFSEGLPVVRRRQALIEARYGTNSVEAAANLGYLGHFLQRVSDFDAAGQALRRALDLREKHFGSDSVEAAQTAKILGRLYREYGDASAAGAMLHRALRIFERHLGPTHPEVGDTCYLLSWHYKPTDSAQCEACLLRAKECFEKAGKSRLGQLGDTLSGLASLYANLGDLSKAEPLSVAGVKLKEEHWGPDHADTAGGLNTLAMIHHWQGRLEEAAVEHRRALRIQERVFGSNSLVAADSLQGLGGTFQDMKDSVQAEAHYLRALRIRETKLGPDNRITSLTRMTLADLYRECGRLEESHAQIKETVAAYERTSGTTHLLYANALRQLAMSEMDLVRMDAAVVTARRFHAAREAILANVLSFTSERQRLAWRNDNRDPCNLLATLGDAPALALAQLRYKGIVLDSIVEDRLRALDKGDPEHSQLIQRLRTAQTKLNDLSVGTTGAGTSEERTRRDREKSGQTEEIDRLEGLLARTTAGIGRTRRALRVTVEEVQARIPPRTLLVDMLRYEHYRGSNRWETRYGAVILGLADAPRWVELGNAADIEKVVRLYQHQMRGPDSAGALAATLRHLHDLIWAPVAAVLPPDAETIFISPDAELNFVSFVTLLNPANEFLGEKLSLAYVASGRDLLPSATPNAAANASLEIWANPDFASSLATVDATQRPRPKNDVKPVLISQTKSPPPGDGVPGVPSRLRALRGLSLQPLPGAEREGRKLKSLAKELGYTGATLRVGKDATEAGLGQLAAPRALHLSTHGFFLPEDAAVGSMQRSGLALAGAQQTLKAWSEGRMPPVGADGIVTAEEIARLNLRGTWLVVLSACDTGLGEARSGEGVLGLRRGFVLAGAQNLVMTLWPIEDGQTSSFMTDFYSRAHQTKNAPLALAQVQRQWMARLKTKRDIAAACRVAGSFILSFQAAD